MGRLGPDLDTEDKVEARTNRDKIKDYAARVRLVNQGESARHRTRQRPSGDAGGGAGGKAGERRRIPTAREKALEYAKTQVPKPEAAETARRAPSPATTAAAPPRQAAAATAASSAAPRASSRTQPQRGGKAPRAGAEGGGGGAMSDLDRMLMQHELDQERVRGLLS